MNRFLLLLSCCALAAAPMTGSAGEISCPSGACDLSGATAGLVWKPSSRCVRPPRPALPTRVGEHNAAVDAFNAWIGEATAYMKCVDAEAVADAPKLAPVIGAAAQKILNEVTEEGRITREELNRRRP